MQIIFKQLSDELSSVFASKFIEFFCCFCFLSSQQATLAGFPNCNNNFAQSAGETEEIYLKGFHLISEVELNRGKKTVIVGRKMK